MIILSYTTFDNTSAALSISRVPFIRRLIMAKIIAKILMGRRVPEA